MARRCIFHRRIDGRTAPSYNANTVRRLRAELAGWIMTKQYVEQRDGQYWVIGIRVSLDSIVYAFLEGKSAESIALSYPVLTLEEVYGAIAFYLSDRDTIDEYLGREREEFDRLLEEARSSDPMFYQKLLDAVRRRHAA
jgi:uncharacterized protein (DUF433 family)